MEKMIEEVPKKGRLTFKFLRVTNLGRVWKLSMTRYNSKIAKPSKNNTYVWAIFKGGKRDPDGYRRDNHNHKKRTKNAKKHDTVWHAGFIG